MGRGTCGSNTSHAVKSIHKRPCVGTVSLRAAWVRRTLRRGIGGGYLSVDKNFSGICDLRGGFHAAANDATQSGELRDATGKRAKRIRRRERVCGFEIALRSGVANSMKWFKRLLSPQKPFLQWPVFYGTTRPGLLPYSSGVFSDVIPCTLFPQERRYFEEPADSCRPWPPF